MPEIGDPAYFSSGITPTWAMTTTAANTGSLSFAANTLTDSTV